MNKNTVKTGGGMKETIKGLVDIMEDTVSEKVFNNTTPKPTPKPTVQVVTPSSKKYSSKDSFGDHHSQFTNLLNQ